MENTVDLGCSTKIGQLKRNLSPKTNLMFSSTEFCQAIFEERDVRETLDGGGGHGAMIPPLRNEGAHIRLI